LFLVVLTIVADVLIIVAMGSVKVKKEVKF